MIKSKSSIGSLERLTDIGDARNVEMLLDKNERTYPFDWEIHKQILDRITPGDLIQYPDQSNLYKKLAGFLCRSTTELLLTPGADAGLKYIFDTFIDPGCEVIHLQPTYGMVSVYSNMFAARTKRILYDDDLSLNVERMLDVISDSTRLIVIANPNQPTGTIISWTELRQIIDKAYANDTLVVIDEAYIEFSDSESTISMVTEYPNLCVLRTFSKAWGLAGVRLGYLVAQPRVIEQLLKVKPLLDINVFAIKAAEVLIDNYSIVESHVQEVKSARQYMYNKLDEIGLTYFKSNGNFLNIRLPDKVSDQYVAKELRDYGYLIRASGSSTPVLSKCIRVTVGTRNQVDGLLESLNSVLNGK